MKLESVVDTIQKIDNSNGPNTEFQFYNKDDFFEYFDQKLFDIKMNYYQFVTELKKVFSIFLNKKLGVEHKIQITDWLGEQIIHIPQFIVLTFENWCIYAEKVVVSKIENDMTRTILPVQFFEDIEFDSSCTYIVLGATQQNYESSDYAYLSNLEIDKLKTDLGFNFESKEFSDQILDEFCNMFEKNINPEIRFVSPMYSMKSEKQNDPKFLNQLNHFGFCEVTSSSTEDIVFFEETNENNLSTIDVNLNNELTSIREYESASSLQKYINCPYTYFCEYVLSMKRKDEIDIEPSPILKGRIYHSLLEDFLDNSKVTTPMLEERIKKNIIKEYKYWKDVAAIQDQMKIIAEKINKYVHLDIDTKKTQNRITFSKEIKFSAYFNLESMRFSNIKSAESDVLIKGTIDRIDKIDEKIYVFDYKLTSAKSYNDWKTNLLVQMPIYGLMIIDGVLPIEGELSQLSYIVINNDFKYKNGLSVNHNCTGFNLGISLNKSNSFVDYQSICKELDIFRELLKTTLIRIKSANFSPSPISPEKCFSCDWKDSCHARHLY